MSVVCGKVKSQFMVTYEESQRTTTNTTLQYIVNAKLSQQKALTVPSEWANQDNTNDNPQKLFASFKSACSLSVKALNHDEEALLTLSNKYRL